MIIGGLKEEYSRKAAVHYTCLESWWTAPFEEKTAIDGFRSLDNFYHSAKKIDTLEIWKMNSEFGEISQNSVSDSEQNVLK